MFLLLLYLCFAVCMEYILLCDVLPSTENKNILKNKQPLNYLSLCVSLSLSLSLLLGDIRNDDDKKEIKWIANVVKEILARCYRNSGWFSMLLSMAWQRMSETEVTFAKGISAILLMHIVIWEHTARGFHICSFIFMMRLTCESV